MEDVKEKVKEPQMGLTFEMVWAMFQETDKKFDRAEKLIEENAKGFAEVKAQSAETDKKFAETRKYIEEVGKRVDKVCKRIDKLGKHIGEVDNRLGDIVEHIMSPGAKTAFEGLGYKFPKATPNVLIDGVADGKNKTLAEVDMLLESADCVLAVEIKTKPTVKHVNRHILRMEILRQDADKRGDTRPLLGGIAGAVVAPDVRNYALEKGLFVIEQSGIDLNIVPPQGKPREW
jgi:hypothetical protein